MLDIFREPSYLAVSRSEDAFGRNSLTSYVTVNLVSHSSLLGSGMQGSFCWFLHLFAPRDVFPSVVCRPRCSVGRPAARSASWLVWTRGTVTSSLVAFLAGFAGDSAHRAVLLSLSSGPRCLASWLVWIRRTGVSSRSSSSLSFWTR